MSIGLRISLLVVLAVTACMALFGAYSERTRRTELREDALEDAAEVGSTLDVVLNEVLAERPLAELAHLPDEISHAHRIYGLAILDSGRDEMISSRTVAPRRAEVHAMAMRAVREGKHIASEAWFGDTHTAVYAFPLRRGQHDVVGAAVVLRDLSSMDEMIDRSRLRLVGVGIALALTVLGVVIAVSRLTVTRPVTTLIESVRRIGEGDLTADVPVQRRDELGRIAAALARMRDDLLRAREQIRADLERRIQLEQTLEIERKMQHAQRLAAVGQIAASIAHEIGSPLHVIAGRARFAAGRDEPAEMRENLLVIATQSDRITRAVEQLMSLARRRQPRMEDVDLSQVARTVVELLGPQATEQRVELSLAVHARETHTHGDPDGLQQVLFNLVLNAVQAQPQGGRVDVVLDRADELDSLGSSRRRIVIEVRDKGPGVPQERRESVFEPFSTGRESSGGTGLGLAVVRGIVRDHAGAIRVTDNLGGGAVFRVSLPSNDE